MSCKRIDGNNNNKLIQVRPPEVITKKSNNINSLYKTFKAPL